MESVHEMRARFSALLAEMEEITARDMSAADVKKFDRLDAEMTELQRKIETAERRSEMITRSSGRERGDSADFNVNRCGDPFDADTVRLDASVPDLRARVATGLERDDATPDELKAAAIRTLEQVHGDRRGLALRCLVTGSEAYRTAYSKLMSGQQAMWSEAERQAVLRAQSLTDAAGGFAVPFTLDPSMVLTNDGSVNPIRSIARVVTTTSDSWNGVTSTGTTASWDAEAAEVSDDAVTLVQPSIPVHKAQNFIPFSVEVGGDWASIETDLREAMADARDRLEATAHIKGTGSGQPTGIEVELTGGASVVSPATAEVFAAADVYETQRQLPARHRPAAQWVMNLGTSNDIRQFDTGGGGNFWTSLGGGTPERLLGWSANIASEVDDSPDINPAATETNFVLFVGDWSRYVIVDRVGMSVEMVPHLFGDNNRPTGQRGLYAWWRTGAESIDDNAFRVLGIATTA